MSNYNRKTTTLTCRSCGGGHVAHAARGSKEWVVSRLDEPPDGRRFSISAPQESYTCRKCHTLDDVMDWYGLAREEGETLQIWQRRYPQFAADLAEFEMFLQAADADKGEGEK